MKSARRFLDNANIGYGLRMQEIAHHQKGTDQKRTLRRRADGTLEFLNGTAVKRHELLPGETYTIIETTGIKTGGKK